MEYSNPNRHIYEGLAFSIVLIILLILAGLLSSCCPCRHLGQDSYTRDSVRVEIHDSIVERIDTVEVMLPIDRVVNVTTDTVSTIETSAAISTAVVDGGYLRHTIYNKDVPVKVQVVTKEVYRDTTIYKDKIIRTTNNVEVHTLTGWQQFQRIGFWIVLSVLIISVLWRRFVNGKFQKWTNSFQNWTH